MIIQTNNIEFSKLRSSYTIVKSFLERESFRKVNSLDTKISEDLGLDGDDNLDFIEKFVSTFNLNYGEFDYNKHFYSETELFNPISSFLFLIIILPIKIFDFLTFKKLKIKYPNFNPNREVSDLTFRELLTWHLEGKYYSDRKIKYQLAH